MRRKFGLGLGLGLGLTLGKGGGGAAPVDYLAQWIGATPYANWDARDLTTQFTTSAESTPVAASGDKVGSWRSKVGGYTALQAGATQRLNHLITGTRHTNTGDGGDDNLLTSYPSAASNTVFFDLDPPPLITGSIWFFGRIISGSDRFQFGFSSTGLFNMQVGSQINIAGITDFRGLRCVGAISHDGADVRIFSMVAAVPTLEYQGAQSGSVSASVTRLCAYEALGSPAGFFPGGIARLVPVQKGGLTLSDWQNIGPQLVAAGA